MAYFRNFTIYFKPLPTSDKLFSMLVEHLPSLSSSCDADVSGLQSSMSSTAQSSFEFLLQRAKTVSAFIRRHNLNEMRTIIPSVANAANTVQAIISTLLSLPLVFWSWDLAALVWKFTTRLLPDKVGKTLEVCFSGLDSNQVGSLVIGFLYVVGEVVDTFSRTVSELLDRFDSLLQGIERTLHFFFEFTHSSAISSFSSLQHSVQGWHPKINCSL